MPRTPSTVDLWTARQDDPVVVDTALSWDHGTADIHVGAVKVTAGEWPCPVVVIGYTMDTEGNRDAVDFDDAKRIACDVALERWPDIREGWEADRISDDDPDNEGMLAMLVACVEAERVDLTPAARAGNLPAEWLARVALGERLDRCVDGGYPLLYLTNEGDTLCAECATKACTGEETSTEREVHYSVFYEGAPETCCSCDVAIPSAYGDPNAEKSEAYVRSEAGKRGPLTATKAADVWSEVAEGLDEEWPIVDNDGKPFRDLFIALVTGAAVGE